MELLADRLQYQVTSLLEHRLTGKEWLGVVGFGLLCSSIVPSEPVGGSLLLLLTGVGVAINQKAVGESSRRELEASNYIERFVAAFIVSDSRWPEPYQLPAAHDILALSTLLENNRLRVAPDRLAQFVANEVSRQRLQKFTQSFMRLYPQLDHVQVSRSGGLEQWAFAYVNTFENNLDYVSDLADMIQERGIRVDLQKLRKQIQDQIWARSHQRRVEVVSQAIQTGGTIRRTSIDDVDLMDGLQFEQFLGRLFKALGYQAQVTRASGDQGADLVLEKFGERTVVQAKRYSDQVSNSAIQEVVAAKAHYGCHHAMVVTNNRFTNSAQELAASNGVALWDREKLAHTITMYL